MNDLRVPPRELGCDLAITLTLTSDQLDALAERVANLLAARQPTADRWLRGARAAAEHLDVPVSRVYDLVERSELRYEKDGSRLMFRQSWLDAYLEAAA